MKDSENPYKLLKVDSEAPLEVVKAAYKALMKTGSIHPDLGGENNLAQDINNAYQILSDSEQRSKLDVKLKKSQKVVTEKIKEINEYFVICFRCQAINRILHPQWIKQSQCAQCNSPFIITKKEPRKTTPSYTVKTADIPKESDESVEEELAQEFYNRKMYLRAIGEYKSLVARQPKEAHYRFKLGLCYYSMQYYRDSLVHFCKAIKKDNQFTDAYLLAGKSLLQMARYSEAIEHFTRAKKTTNETYKIEANIGVCRYKMGLFSQTISALLPIAENHPTYERIAYFLAMAFYQMHDFHQAKKYFQLAKFNDSDNEKIAELIGICNRYLSSYVV